MERQREAELKEREVVKTEKDRQMREKEGQIEKKRCLERKIGAVGGKKTFQDDTILSPH